MLKAGIELIDISTPQLSLRTAITKIWVFYSILMSKVLLRVPIHHTFTDLYYLWSAYLNTVLPIRC